jgi:hypothetical protein
MQKTGLVLTAFIAVRDMIFSSVEEQLESAELLPQLGYHKEGALIIRQLLEKESISRETFYKLVGVSTARKLLETNIFAYHFNSREVTFQSTVMKRFCEEHSDRWGSDSKGQDLVELTKLHKELDKCTLQPGDRTIA